MENVYLAPLTMADKDEFEAMRNEFFAAGGWINPGAIRRYNGDFAAYLKMLDDYADPETVPDGRVESDTYVLRDEKGRLYGMSSLRRRLTDDLLVSGGHIGYGIRPSERRKGYGAKQLSLLLDKCRALGITRVLITCDHDNIGSAKTILKCGGVFADEITEEDGTLLQRYWITL